MMFLFLISQIRLSNSSTSFRIDLAPPLNIGCAINSTRRYRFSALLSCSFGKPSLLFSRLPPMLAILNNTCFSKCDILVYKAIPLEFCQVVGALSYSLSARHSSVGAFSANYLLPRLPPRRAAPNVSFRLTGPWRNLPKGTPGF